MAGLIDSQTTAAHGTTVFTDSVDGNISLESYCLSIIDTPPFQRLRELSQLGVTRFVFSGAVHSRFEHSLGVAHKAYKVARHIFKQQGGERAAGADGVGVDMEEADVKLVTLAGLCHDLGHGPLSHPFENFLKRLGIRHWKHEGMSGQILEYLVDEYGIDLERSDQRHITDLIRGHPEQQQPAARGAGAGGGGAGGLWRPGRRFLFDIVANKRNGVDVDKVDYLKRDAAMCGVRVGCDFERFIKKKFVKVIDDEVCYLWSEYDNVLDLFRSREIMHRKIYTNRRCKAVELMAVDALVAVEPLLHFSERLHQPAEFISLDDSLLSTIEFYRMNYRGTLSDVEDKALEAAQGIVRRIRTRDLYRFGNQFTVPTEYLKDGRWEAIRNGFTAQELASCYGGSELSDLGGLRPEDIICDENKIDHTMGGANPAELVGFFKSYDSQEKFHIGHNQVVGIMPQFFQERVLRVFTPRPEERYVRAIEEALRNWCARHFGSAAQLATPLRPRRATSEAPSGEGELPVLPRFLLPREAVHQQAVSGVRHRSEPSGVAAAAIGGRMPGAVGASNRYPAGPGGGVGGGGVHNGSVELTPPRAVVRPDPGQGGPLAWGGRGVGAGDVDTREAGCGKRQRTGSAGSGAE